MIDHRLTISKCSICGSTNWNNIYSSDQAYCENQDEINVNVVMCNDCGFLFNNPRPKNEILIQHYKSNSSGSVYRDTDQNSRYGRLINERIKFVLQCINNQTDGRLLDVGCGNGFFLESIPLINWKKKGIDFSNDFGDQINNSEIELINCDILKFEPLEKFDLITCFSSFEHFFEPEKVLEKLHNILNPKGILIVDVPDCSNPKPGLGEFFCFEHLSHFTPFSLQNFLARNKFQIFNQSKFSSEFRNLIVAAKKSEAVLNHSFENKEEIIKTINNYKLESDKLKKNIFNILNKEIKPIIDNKGQIAIYGAGYHSYDLLKHYDFKNSVRFFIDSDPKKWNTEFLKLEILPPESIRKMKVDAILISSQPFENEIFETIQKFNESNIPVTKLYNQNYI